MTFSVYTLAGPDGVVRYVGFTSVPLALRLRRHLNDGVRVKTRKNNWIKSLRRNGERPEIDLLAEYETRESALAGEVEWIETMRYLGFDLVNGTAGGEGSRDASPETRAKMRAAKVGRKLTAEHKARIGAAHKARGTKPPINRGHSAETRAKMSLIARTSPNHKVPSGWNRKVDRAA